MFHWMYKGTFHSHGEILKFFCVLVMFHVSDVSSLVMEGEVALWVHRRPRLPKVLCMILDKLLFFPSLCLSYESYGTQQSY